MKWVLHQRTQLRHAYSNSFRKMGNLTPKNLKEYFVVKLNSCRDYSNLKYEYVNIRRVCNFSYYMVNDYPQLNLLMDETPKETKRFEINKETIERSIVMLREEGDFENCLMLILISKYYLNSGVLTLVRFEDFGTRKDGRQFLNIFIKRKMRHEMIYVDEETFAVVRELKKSTLANKRQQYETKRSWGKSCKIKGHFIFPVQRCSIGRRLQNGFNGIIPEFSSCA